MAPGDQTRLVFAAASEAVQFGSKGQGAQLLQQVLDRAGDDLPVEAEVCLMYRCTTRLLLDAISEEGSSPELLARLCGIFKSGESTCAQIPSARPADRNSRPLHPEAPDGHREISRHDFARMPMVREDELQLRCSACQVLAREVRH